MIGFFISISSPDCVSVYDKAYISYYPLDACEEEFKKP
ncbi:hypothetical protein KNP414_05644 [Paenibacillus mucilaginosus KNP414]|uniref:Uncharacterized protein n=1 Tax=Paenibacillus mucilaginosus (strain KNP414) TaxID=1036673 RepID=F8FLP1_PAEMK|nr:hypothetical protein KNP414_05644 [Paenibacillus mucilaginosus KNP414]